jgi:hypothetical protein
MVSITFSIILIIFDLVGRCRPRKGDCVSYLLFAGSRGERVEGRECIVGVLLFIVELVRDRAGHVSKYTIFPSVGCC